MKTETERPLPDYLRRIIAELPRTVTLHVHRDADGDLPCEDYEREYSPGVTPGYFVALAPVPARDGGGGAWGGAETAEDALRKCITAGGVPHVGAKRPIQLRILWQPLEARKEHVRRYPDLADEVGAPYVSEDGFVCAWGSPGAVDLYPVTMLRQITGGA